MANAFMPKYFFHDERGGRRITDFEGIVLPDLESAKQLALETAAEVASEDLATGLPLVEQFIIITGDDRCGELLRVRVEACNDVQERRASR
jgi:hypothetical protein